MQFNWTTVEVQHDFGKAYPDLESAYLKSIQKPEKTKKKKPSAAVGSANPRSTFTFCFISASEGFSLSERPQAEKETMFAVP